MFTTWISGATGKLTCNSLSIIHSDCEEADVKILSRLELRGMRSISFYFVVILVLCCVVLFYFMLKCVTVTVTVGFSREILVCLVVFFSCKINLIFLVLSKHVRIRLPSRLIFRNGF